MSIETLLEAAKFLELQAQQQKARGKLVFFFIILYILFQIHPPATYSPKVQHASIQQFRENDFFCVGVPSNYYCTVGRNELYFANNQ